MLQRIQQVSQDLLLPVVVAEEEPPPFEPRLLHNHRADLRQWEYNATVHSRYDYLLAAPSDHTLRVMWTAWAVIAFIVGIISVTVFLGILSNAKARSNSFNFYILFLAFPDFFLSLCCAVTCTLNAVKGEYWSHLQCNFQSFYVVFAISANTWLNAVLAHQLHKMLHFSHCRRRYHPPSRRTVAQQAAVVYVYCTILGLFCLIDQPWFPFHTRASSGMACVPVEIDKRSSLFFWLVFFPLFVGIPIVYITWVCYDIYHRQLMPPTPDKRYMFIYYGRIILVFFIMWLPTLVLGFLLSSWLPPWGFWAGGTWSHMQGAVSSLVSLMKPDIFRAVRKFVTCQWWHGGNDNDDDDDDAEDEHDNNNNNVSNNAPPVFPRRTWSYSPSTSSIVAALGATPPTSISQLTSRQERTNSTELEMTVVPEERPSDSSSNNNNNVVATSNEILEQQQQPDEENIEDIAAATQQGKVFDEENAPFVST